MSKRSESLKWVWFVMQAVECEKHSAEKGDPCWWAIPRSVCNQRAMNAGCNGKISPVSYVKQLRKI